MKATKLKRALSYTIDQLWGDEAHNVVSRVFFGPARGLRLKLNMHESAEFEFALGRYESKVAKMLRQHVNKGDVVWECGVHIGYFTCMLAKMVGPEGKVLGFEPDPINRERAATNLQLNHMTNTELLPVAVGESKSEVKFVAGSGATSSFENTFVGWQPGPFRAANMTVQSVSLDDVLISGKYPRPDVLKMDIEGAEIVALPNALRLISEVRPKVFIESHNLETDQMIWDIFTSHKYTLHQILRDKPISSPKEVQLQVLALPQ